jgi:prevent-host-death family protein
MQPPVVINISRLHRQTSAVVRQAETADRPVFVTQFACVVAVLLPRSMYDRLLRAAESGPGADGGSPPDGRRPPDSVSRSLESPLAVFGPLPQGTRFMTRRGYVVDAELAAFLMEDGEEVRPIPSE